MYDTLASTRSYTLDFVSKPNDDYFGRWNSIVRLPWTNIQTSSISVSCLSVVCRINMASTHSSLRRRKPFSVLLSRRSVLLASYLMVVFGLLPLIFGFGLDMVKCSLYLMCSGYVWFQVVTMCVCRWQRTCVRCTVEMWWWMLRQSTVYQRAQHARPAVC